MAEPVNVLQRLMSNGVELKSLVLRVLKTQFPENPEMAAMSALIELTPADQLLPAIRLALADVPLEQIKAKVAQDAEAMLPASEHSRLPALMQNLDELYEFLRPV